MWRNPSVKSYIKEYIKNRCVTSKLEQFSHALQCHPLNELFPSDVEESLRWAPVK